MGRGACVIWSMGGAGVVALAAAVDACRHCQQTYCGARVVVAARRSCFDWRRNRGGIVNGVRESSR